MYKILCVSAKGCIGDLCIRLQDEGHEVKYCIEDFKNQDVMDGFVPKVKTWDNLTSWADLIVFDDCGYGIEADALRKAGKKVIGGSVYTDKLEMDRGFGQEEMEKAGLSILPHWEFKSFDEAINFIKKNPGRYVVKPDGEAQNDKVLSFCGREEDGQDLIATLEHYKKDFARKIKSFQIQKFASGVEVAIGGFFNGSYFVGNPCINFEYKKMFPGNIGPSTGEMGTLLFWPNHPILSQMILDPLEKYLEKSGYCGYFDINCIATPRAVYPLEATSRFGIPTLSIQMDGIKSEMGEFLMALASSRDFNPRTIKGFQIGVVVAVPPFPFIDPKAFEKYSKDAIVLFSNDNQDGVYPADIKSKNGDWHLAGDNGYALVVCGYGNTVDDAKKIAYDRIENIIIPNMFYRNDIGYKWEQNSDLLRSWGYL